MFIEPTRDKSGVREFVGSHITSIILLSLIALFVASASYFAIKLERGIVPDEVAHFTLSQQYAQTWGIPADVPATIPYGYMGHGPFLYYWINGRILNAVGLVAPGLSDWRQEVLLRLVSVLYSILTLILIYLLSKEIIPDRWWQLLPVFFLANTLMFVFLSGGVSYDNLANLCALAGVYFLTRLFNGRPLYENSLGWLISISFGILVKITLLPLAAIMGAIWILFIVLNRKHIVLRPAWNPTMVGLTAVLSLLFLLNLSVWGVNLATYHALKPPCNRILTQDQCNQNPQIAVAIRLFLPRKLTWQEAADSGSDPLEYVWNYWTFSMLKRIYGIMGHKAYFPNFIITFYRLLLGWIILVAVRYWKKPSYTMGSLIAIFVFYSLVLLLQVNYNSELTTGFRHVAIQGRYIFPVIGIAYVLAGHYLLQIRSAFVRRATVVFALLLFLWGSPLSLYINLPPALSTWFH